MIPDTWVEITAMGDSDRTFLVGRETEVVVRMRWHEVLVQVWGVWEWED